jgi:probable biosynthetic protein (TIGR04098 family)
VLIEESELTLGLVGLGALTEYAAMTLCADAQAHALTAGTGGTLRDIVDAAGHPLYPGYFWTHLIIPPERRLERHQIWDRVAVGVTVGSWGPILESSYLLGTPEELARSETERPPLPALRAASMFFAGRDSGEPQPSTPRHGTIATLPKLAAAPAAVAKFREARVGGIVGATLEGSLRLGAPLEVPIVAGRDAAVGHSLLFAQFVRIFELGERALLTSLRPPMHAALLDHLSLLEREIYYVDNCGPGARVAVDGGGRIERCPPRLTGKSDEVSAAITSFELTAHDATSGRLLAVCRARKLLVVPKSRPSYLHDSERVCRAYAEKPS